MRGFKLLHPIKIGKSLVLTGYKSLNIYTTNRLELDSSKSKKIIYTVATDVKQAWTVFLMLIWRLLDRKQ